MKLEGDRPHLQIPALTKTGDGREVPLLPEVVEALRPLVLKTKKGKVLFPQIAHQTLGGPASPMNIALVLRADLDEIGIPVETDDGIYDFHAMRKEAATYFALQGVPEPITAKILGHRPGSRMTAEVYTKVRQDDVYEQLKRAKLA